MRRLGGMSTFLAIAGNATALTARRMIGTVNFIVGSLYGYVEGSRQWLKKKRSVEQLWIRIGNRGYNNNVTEEGDVRTKVITRLSCLLSSQIRSLHFTGFLGGQEVARKRLPKLQFQHLLPTIHHRLKPTYLWQYIQQVATSQGKGFTIQTQVFANASLPIWFGASSPWGKGSHHLTVEPWSSSLTFDYTTRQWIKRLFWLDLPCMLPPKMRPLQLASAACDYRAPLTT